MGTATTWIVANPVPRRAAACVASLDAAVREPWGPELRWTTPEEPGAVQAREAVAAGATTVLVVGGDGTVREVAGALAGTGVRLGIVPAGTANVFARNLGIPRGRDAVAMALSARTQAVDVGRADWACADGATGSGAFLVMAGIGHDADTIEAVRDGLKRRLGWGAYFAAGATTALRPGGPMVVEADGVRTVGPAWSVLVGNCGLVPPGIPVFPDALPDDGLLDVARVAVERPWHWPAIAAKGLLRLRRDVPRLDYAHARRVAIEPATPQRVALDGDVVATATRLECRVDERALKVCVPSA